MNNYTINQPITHSTYTTELARSIKNHHSLMAYIDNLFRRHSRLLVLRVDLGYRKDIDNSLLSELEIYEKYWQAKVDREHLFGNMRTNKLFDHMVGYVWKLEYGIDKGFHYHMMFFFDGSKVRQDINIARMIGEYWVTVITHYRGLYYNCNARKEEDYASYCGIGMINYYDAELIENLKMAASYLIKPDDFTKMKVPNIERTFGKKQIPDKVTDSGRPRKYPSELAFNPPMNNSLNSF